MLTVYKAKKWRPTFTLLLGSPLESNIMLTFEMASEFVLAKILKKWIMS